MAISDALRNDRLILEAAARGLAEDPKATMQRIADEAGVARLTVYRRYHDREALRRAIFEAAAAEAQQVIPDPLGDDLDPVGRTAHSHHRKGRHRPALSAAVRRNRPATPAVGRPAPFHSAPGQSHATGGPRGSYGEDGGRAACDPTCRRNCCPRPSPAPSGSH
ncbi:hypothetical protein GCM10027176_15020 [Actinoallomurus bryophytorum]|uniref:TetR/AcrR family transcriptional regulator n=1 Tax=Actinoallomurus bryophytorum TaxID=1490222 RepID=UPI00114F900B|nr:TetR/AcrR family transcriptional regulator [Actinoallomurus bryophytorum]